MLASKELLFRLLIISVGVFILVRYILPLIWASFADSFLGQKKKNNNIDFDLMVENQKQMIRAQAGMNTQGPATQTTGKKSSATHQFYKDAFSEASKKGSKNLNDLKMILSLWDSLEWGVSEQVNQLAKKLSQIIGIRVESQALFDLIKFCDRRELFLPPVGAAPLTYNDIVAILESLSFSEIFIFGHNEVELARKLKIQSGVLLKLRSAVINSLRGVDSKKAQIEALGTNQAIVIDPPEREILLIKMIKEKKGIKTREEILEGLMAPLTFIKTLMPMPELKGQKDLEGALQLFEADQNTPLETIKKRYKRMASERHPDKLLSLGIPSEFEKIATENFAQIQMAYNIIQQNKKD